METSRYAESPEWYEVMLDHYPPPEPEVLQIYHLGMTGVEGRYQIDQRAKQVALTAYAQEDVRCWGAWDTISRSITNSVTPLTPLKRWAQEKASVEYQWFIWKNERVIVMVSIKPTLETFQRHHLGKLLKEENFWKTSGGHACFLRDTCTLLIRTKQRVCIFPQMSGSSSNLIFHTQSAMPIMWGQTTNKLFKKAHK